MIDENIVYLTPLGREVFIRGIEEIFNISLKDFAIKVDIPYSQLTKLIKDKNSFFTREIMEKILKKINYFDEKYSIINLFFSMLSEFSTQLNLNGKLLFVKNRLKFEQFDTQMFSYFLEKKYNLSLEKFALKIDFSYSNLKNFFYKRNCFFTEILIEKIIKFFNFKYKNLDINDCFKLLMIEIYRYFAINKLNKKSGEMFEMKGVI